MSAKLAMKIKAARRAALLTQLQAAEKLGISRGSVTQWEAIDPKVRHQPTMENLHKFSEITSVPVGWFINDNYPVGDVHRVRAMHMAGTWVDDAPPPQVDALAANLHQSKVLGPEVISRNLQLASALRSYRTPEEREEFIEERREKSRLAESFWMASEFAACTEKPGLQTHFGQRMMLGGEIPMRVDFLNHHCAIRFGGVEPEAGPAGAMYIKRHIADLLMVEAINKAPLRKIIAYWDDDNERTPRRYLNDGDFQTALGIEIMYFKTVDELSTFLTTL